MRKCSELWEESLRGSVPLLLATVLTGPGQGQGVEGAGQIWSPLCLDTSGQTPSPITWNLPPLQRRGQCSRGQGTLLASGWGSTRWGWQSPARGKSAGAQGRRHQAPEEEGLKD